MNNSNDTLIQSLARLLRPLVRILLRSGIPYGTFVEVAKQVFVEVAERDFPPPGRKQSDSRIATITGLHRKDVVRLKNQPSLQGAVLIERYNRAARVISGWLSDADFQNAEGRPRALPVEAAGQPDFHELVRRYSGDMPVRAIADELIRVGAVTVGEDGVLYLSRAAYVPSEDIEARVTILGTDVADLITTIDYNLVPNQSQTRFQLKVAYDHLPQEIIPVFHQLASEESFRLLRQFDAFLREHDQDLNPAAKGTGRVRAGVGIYYFEETLDKEP
jgi:hypothetical protein